MVWWKPVLWCCWNREQSSGGLLLVLGCGWSLQVCLSQVPVCLAHHWQPAVPLLLLLASPAKNRGCFCCCGFGFICESNQWRKGRLCVETVTGNGIYFGTTDFSLWELKTAWKLTMQFIDVTLPRGHYCIAWGGESRYHAFRLMLSLDLSLTLLPSFLLNVLK